MYTFGNKHFSYRKQNIMIVITGAAGFIGSNILTKLNMEGFKDIILVDKFDNPLKNKNFEAKTYTDKIDREDFFEWAEKNQRFIQFIVHMGARSDTTEQDVKVFDKLNYGYTKKIWDVCSDYGIPLIYASSAATYGDGSLGYIDDHEIVESLEPLNLYGKSKNDLDKWALKQEKQPFFWAGLKFFNVYGPNEYHKGRMASVILHTYKQIQETSKMKLFRSHRPDYKDGEQLRDFIYVKDVAEIVFFLMNYRKNSGLYNVGTGKARTFYDLAKSTFLALGLKPEIEFIDTPMDIRDKYQYFTEARMEKLRATGFQNEFHLLEEGIRDYVRNYLVTGAYN